MGRSRVDNFGLVLKTSNVTSRELVELCAPCHSRRTELGGTTTAALAPRQPAPNSSSGGPVYPDGQDPRRGLRVRLFVQSKMFRMASAARTPRRPHAKLKKTATASASSATRPRLTTTRATLPQEEWKGKPSDGRSARPATCRSRVHGRSPCRRHSIRIPRPDLTRTSACRTRAAARAATRTSRSRG